MWVEHGLQGFQRYAKDLEVLSLELWEVIENVLSKGGRVYDKICIFERSLCS